MSKVNFKGFIAYSTQANWNAVRKIYGVGNPSLPMVGRERTFIFHWFQSLDKVTLLAINPTFKLRNPDES